MTTRALLVVVAACTPPATAPRFDKQVVDPAFRSEGVAVFDVDLDGHDDLVTDQLWYAGPAFADAHALRPPETYDPAARWSECSAAFGDDIDGDGFTDLVVAPFPSDAAYWYRNPGDDGMWERYQLAPPLGAGPETPIYVDLLRDGRRELVVSVEPAFQLAYLVPGDDPTQPWVATAISAPGFAGAYHFAHGLGAGDVDADNRLDVLTSLGWFQQTDDPTTWVFHAADFGALECSSMSARDVDGDGLADVICPHPHDYGVSWWQQQQGGTFVEQVLDDTISQMHAALAWDLDRDGTPELISGKTRYAHTTDPGAEDPSELVYYTFPDRERHVIDDSSGVGRQIAVADLDGDRMFDIVIANKNGLFVFHQR